MLSIDQLAVEMCVSFAVTQIARYGADLNVAQTEAHWDGVLKATIHEAWLEGACQSLVDTVLEAVPAICQNADAVKEIMDDVAMGQVPAAITAFKGLVVKLLPQGGEFTAELTQLLTAA